MSALTPLTPICQPSLSVEALLATGRTRARHTLSNRHGLAVCCSDICPSPLRRTPWESQKITLNCQICYTSVHLQPEGFFQTLLFLNKFSSFVEKRSILVYEPFPSTDTLLMFLLLAIGIDICQCWVRLHAGGGLKNKFWANRPSIKTFRINALCAHQNSNQAGASEFDTMLL